MIVYNNTDLSMKKSTVGNGLLNKIINKLPIELHLPGYQYCGPGTKLEKRLKRGDPGINALDVSCREHDIAYDTHKDIQSRHEADKILLNNAWNRVTANDSTFREKADAWFITNAMKAKVKMGMGINCSRNSKKSFGTKEKYLKRKFSQQQNYLKAVSKLQEML